MKKRIILPLLLALLAVASIALLAACDTVGSDECLVKFFEADGKTQIGKTQKCKVGETFTAEAAPTVAGYTFEGWLLAGELYDLTAAGATVAKGNMTFVAQYSEDPCVVTFRDGDTVLATVEVKRGERLLASHIPDTEKMGHTFRGWSAAGATGHFDLNARITESLTLTADYRRLGWVITYLDSDGVTVLDRLVVAEGETPHYTGDLLNSTRVDADGQRWRLISFGTEVPATQDATYTAVWRALTEVREPNGDTYDTDPF